MVTDTICSEADIGRRPLLPARTAHWAAVLELQRADALWLLSMLGPILRSRRHDLRSAQALHAAAQHADLRSLLSGLKGVWYAGGIWFTHAGRFESVQAALTSLEGVTQQRQAAPKGWRTAVLIARPAPPLSVLLASLFVEEDNLTSAPGVYLKNV